MTDGREVGQTIRRLRSTPGFTLAVILTLSLGIGSTTALFTILNAVVLRPLPYPDPERLVVVWTDDVRKQLHQTLVSHPIYRDWEVDSRSFSTLGFSTRNTPVTLTGVADPERFDAARASASMFAVLGGTPLEGRAYTADEERRKEPVVVLSQVLAERRYGAARNALGKVLELDGGAVTVVGVMPSWFQFPTADVQLWLPLGDDRLRTVVVGRLRPGVTLAQARDELTTIGTGLAQKYPDLAADPDFPGFRVNLVPLTEQVTGRDTRLALWLLLGAVALVMAIACANVANLVVARASARQRELAVRTALGASRAQLIGHFLLEAALLTIVAGAIGIALAGWLVRLLVAIAPSSVPRLESVSLDFGVLAFAIGVGLCCVALFGAMPAWHVTRQRQNLDASLREGGRGGSAGAARRAVHRVLIVVEIALTFALVCGAGLLVRSLMYVERIPLGFDARNVLVFRIVVPDAMNTAQRAAFYREAVERLEQVPGVSRVGLISNIFTISSPNTTVRIEGRAEGAQVNTPIADDSASPGLFAALRAQLRRGRFLTEDDNEQSALVAVVNERFARRFWPGENAVDKRFQFLDDRFDDKWVTVVGVVADMRRNGLEQDPLPQIYIPFAQSPSRGADMVVLAGTSPLNLTRNVRETIAAINPSVPVYRVSTLEHRLDTQLASRRFQVLMLCCFAFAALVLAAVGVYGLMRYMVGQRTREIGVRIAMGATRRQVMALVLWEGLRLAGTGLLAGVVLALLLTRSLRTVVYGVTVNDPLTFVIAPAILLLVATAATLEPTWRAVRIDPVRALRAE
jgi:putative ABC transport system permease protein